MKIGLVRHYQVNYKFKKYNNSKGFEEDVINYYKSEVIKNDLKLNPEEWDICYTSDISRAIVTACEIYGNNFYKTDLLREVPISPFINTRLILPIFVWKFIGRFEWMFCIGSQKENKKDTIERAKLFIKENILESKKENILIVFHGFFMKTFQKELIKKGFKGKYISKPENAVLYIYEK